MIKHTANTIVPVLIFCFFVLFDIMVVPSLSHYFI
jgi:hypothetical protein